MLGPCRKSSWTLGRVNLTLVILSHRNRWSETSFYPRIEDIHGFHSWISNELVVVVTYYQLDYCSTDDLLIVAQPYMSSIIYVVPVRPVPY